MGSSVARLLSPTTAIPPFTPPPRRHVTRINVTPHHGGTSEPGNKAPPTLAFAFANPNYYEPINDDIIDKPPRGGTPHVISKFSRYFSIAPHAALPP